MATAAKFNISELLTISIPKEIIEDLNCIAEFNDTSVEDVVYSYIVEGLKNDSLVARRMKFTDKANEVLKRNRVPPKSVDDIFNNLLV